MLQTHDRLIIPDIEIPFPRNGHAETHVAHQMTKKWAVAHAVMPPRLAAAFLDDLGYTNLIAGYYVGAPLPVLVAINDFSLWFFVWDDRHDRDIKHGRREAWARLRDALHLALDEPNRHRRRGEPLVSGFADCVARLYGVLSSRWSKRFAAHFHATIDAYDREYRNRVSGTVPTVDEYLALRRHTFGMWVWIDCLELAASVELPDWLRTSAPYREAALASQEFSAWYNDLHSMPKELAAGDFHNLGIVLAQQEHLSIQQAAELAAHRVQSRIADYQREERRVRQLLNDLRAGPELRAGVERCLFNMRNWISSVYWFHHESGRYRTHAWDDPANPPYVHDPND